jgi:hypothetical protein
MLRPSPPARGRRRLTVASAAAVGLTLLTACSAAPSGSTRARADSGSSARAADQPSLSPLASDCPPGAAGPTWWMLGAPELNALRFADPAAVRHAIRPAELYVSRAGGARGLPGQLLADYTSYRSFARDVRAGRIPVSTRWVMYDNERWSRTPAAEQAHPLRYERLFADLAHQHGYRVILAPAQDLEPGFSTTRFREGRASWRPYLAMGLAAASARLADVYEIQAQPWELPVYRSEHAYARFVAAAAAQARAARPGVIILAGLSTHRVTSAAELRSDFLATRGRVAGYWLNILRDGQPGAVPMAGRLLSGIPARWAARAPGCRVG